MLSWPSWLAYSGRFTHINGYPSAAGLEQASESSPVRDVLHWLPIRQRVDYKLGVLMFNCLHNLAPG